MKTTRLITFTVVCIIFWLLNSAPTHAACVDQYLRQNPHQQGPLWVSDHYLLTQVKLRANLQSNSYDSPEVFWVRYCDSGLKWSSTHWLPIEQVGINSHSRTPIWLSDGEFIVQIDQDGWGEGASGANSIDNPIIGAVRVAAFNGYGHKDCRWLGDGLPVYKKYYNSTLLLPKISGAPAQRRWLWNVPEGFFITQVDLDSITVDRVVSPEHHSPFFGAIRICRLSKK